MGCGKLGCRDGDLEIGYVQLGKTNWLEKPQGLKPEVLELLPPGGGFSRQRPVQPKKSSFHRAASVSLWATGARHLLQGSHQDFVVFKCGSQPHHSSVVLDSSDRTFFRLAQAAPASSASDCTSSSRSG